MKYQKMAMKLEQGFSPFSGRQKCFAFFFPDGGGKLLSILLNEGRIAGEVMKSSLLYCNHVYL